MTEKELLTGAAQAWIAVGEAENTLREARNTLHGAEVLLRRNNISLPPGSARTVPIGGNKFVTITRSSPSDYKYLASEGL